MNEYQCRPAPHVGEDYYRIEVTWDQVRFVNGTPCIGSVQVCKAYDFVDVLDAIRTMEARAVVRQ